MATSGNARRRYRPRREALRALRNAQTRAGHHTDPVRQAATLRRGNATAQAWLNGTHPKLAGTAS
jgi:hypothetical protein